MNNKLYYISGGIALLIVSFLVGRWSSPSIPSAPHGENIHGPKKVAESDESIVWTCSMHPQIQQREPGKCPICGMNLIPRDSSEGSAGPRTFSMSESAKALADIQTTAVEKRFPEAEIRLVGKLGYDETKVRSLTARFPARIDQLFVNFTGVSVKKGEHLARVYSPELLTAQSELITSNRYDPNSAATRSARDKLRLWDLLPEQIEAIIDSGEAKDFFELRTPISGVVVHKNVNEGDYLQTGQPLFKIVDLSDLWLRLDAYESDLTWLRFGQNVNFSVEAYPGETFQGQITFINPEIDRGTRTVSVRVIVHNHDSKLKPGMFARAVAKSRVAKAGNVFAPEFAGKWISPMHPEIVKDGPGTCDICGMDLVPSEELGYVQDPNEEPPLLVPSSAVLRTGKRAIVYVELPDTERPAYQGREIQIGPRAGDEFVVAAGLAEGERVVTNGAFKIDSALQIQAKPSMMNPHGDGDAPMHDHGAHDTVTGSMLIQPGSSESIALVIESTVAKDILPLYFELHSALWSDDLNAAKEALRAIMDTTGHSGRLPALIHQMLDANELDDVRRPHFETLSNVLIESISKNPDIFEESVFRMHCPMVYPDRGADWLQSDSNLLNPYFGSAMLTCGEISGSWVQGRWTSDSEQ